ncbi:MAG TPA: dimethylamine monooxygenase subunit DmmA family protein [Pseudomonas sp.]
MTASSAEPLFSTPRYATEASRHPASRRIVVAQQARAAVALLDHPAPTLLLCLGETLAASPDQEGLPSIEALYLRLQMLLEQAQAGTRMYVCGDESFLWHVYRLARHAGLLGDEIELIRQGARRRLYCVHCANFQDIGSETRCTCERCGVKLFVREHFSQRLGAYMGVCIDPDSPYAREARA